MLIFKNNTSSSGYGGAVFNYGGTFNMNSGAISGTSTSNYGGAVCIWNGGTFNMNGGVISNTSVTWYGGAVFSYASTFNMNGGTISNTSADYYGGAVYNWSGTFELNDGQIENCKTISSSGYGGAVYNNAGNMTMSGGTISNCETQCGGGGIHLESGSLIMNGGTIEGCKVTDYQFYWDDPDEGSNGGGGVSVRTTATFTMNNGLIWKNISSGMDGGGGVANDGTFVMTGGQIIMNDATNGEGHSDEGGGVNNDIGKMTMSGGVIAKNIGQGGIWSGDQNSELTITGGAVFDNYALQIFGQNPSEEDKKVDIVLNTNHWTNNKASVCAASDMSEEAYGYNFTKWYYVGEGWSYAATLVKKDIDGVLPPSGVEIKSANDHAYFRAVYDTLEIEGKEGIYLNGVLGNDGNDATSATNAVATFKKHGIWQMKIKQ